MKSEKPWTSVPCAPFGSAAGDGTAVEDEELLRIIGYNSASLRSFNVQKKAGRVQPWRVGSRISDAAMEPLERRRIRRRDNIKNGGLSSLHTYLN